MSSGTGTALVVVDMQNVFIAPAGRLGVEGADDVVQAVNAWVAHADAQGWPVFYTQDVGPIELPSGDPDHSTDLHPSLDVRGTVVPKGPGKSAGFSGFVLASTAHIDGGGPGGGGLSTLDGLLREAEVDQLVVVGLAADVCVAATARDACRLGYQVSIPLPATAFVHAHPRGDQAALDDLASAGVVLTDQRQS